MTKSELITQLAKDTGLSGNQAGKVVNKLFDLISDALQKGEDVRITGFGTFRRTETKERPGRNPRTGEPIQIPASARVSFSAGSGLLGNVRSGGQGNEAA